MQIDKWANVQMGVKSMRVWEYGSMGVKDFTGLTYQLHFSCCGSISLIGGTINLYQHSHTLIFSYSHTLTLFKEYLHCLVKKMVLQGLVREVL
jgi:hypothetical protein